MYKHCISFQTEKAINQLLKYGYVNSSLAGYYKPKRADKTSFYMDHLQEDELAPLYAYYSMNYCRDQVYPIDARTLAGRWANEMGFMMMEDRYIVEFDIPKHRVVLGKAYGLHLCDKDYVGDDVEMAFTTLYLTDIKMIAKPLTTCNGYEHVVYRPIYLKSDNVIFSEDIGFQGDGYGDNYEKFGWKEPEEGYTFSQLKRMMSQDAWDDFAKIIIPKSYSSREKSNYYKLIKDIKYVKYNGS